MNERIRFQADIQDYIDMSISSTINFPQLGEQNKTMKMEFQNLLEYWLSMHRDLRGFTCYPDGSRGGQPLTEVDYYEAIKHKGVTFEENIERACSGGVCGV
jgi:ribonucleoside-diphosphate reductase alpha chain